MDFRDVSVVWREPVMLVDKEPFEVTVVVGDGTQVFDDDFDFDERVFYYFEDENEFEAHKANTAGNFFQIVGM